jgi:uncharacterized protein with beta-barrel porin domain/cytochrome c553
MLLSSGAPALAQSVAAGAALYVSANCAGCHGSPAAGTPNYRLASNNPKRIKDAIAGVYDATVGGQMSTTALRALTDQELMSLALYIGQVKAPMFKVADGDALLAMRVRSGASTPAIKNIYATLQNNGDGGAARDATTGWTATGNAAAGASHIGTGASMNYGVNYSAPAGTFGVQNFTATATNDAGSDARTVAVTVIGIDAPSAPLVGVKGLPYTTTNPLSTVSCNGCTANGFGGTSLPSGLTVQSDGKITGTATVRGVFAGPSVSGLTTGSTLPSDGAVSRTVQITLVGIDSGNPPTYNQGIAISTPYQVTATGTIVPGPNAYSLSPLPAGMTFDTASGRLAGTPSGTGAAVTVAANTTAGLTSEQITITVIAANAPTNVASTLPLSTVSAIGKKGDAILAAAGFTIAATSGTPVTYSSTELAAIGLEVDPTSGAITGTPNTSGDITVVLRASTADIAGTPLSQTIRINPDTAPTVNLVTPPDGNVGTPFPTFSVAAGPAVITAFAVAGGSSLPPGLSLNTGSGAITGMPTASGIFRARFTATNAEGISPPGELSFNINANAKPTITSPTFATMAAGAAITPIQVMATNPVITSYRATGLPTGLQIDTGTGVISGTPITPGTYPVKLSADNAATGVPFGAELLVQFNVGIPVPTACTMSVPLNTPTTLDLASCLFAGFVPTGVSIVATPAHGGAVANGTQVTYTPVNNYFGADSFTFVGSGAGGTSPRGTVTVTVTGRPDPAQDAVVTRMVSAQTETARRFAGAQISNFQRRMESLHRGPGATGRAGLSVQAQSAPVAGGFAAAATVTGVANTANAANNLNAANTVVAAMAGSNRLQPQPGGEVSPQTPGGINSLAANHTPAVARDSEVLDALAAGLGIKSMPLAEGALSLIRSRSVNLAGIASGMGLNTRVSDPRSTSYWIEGVATFGTRDATGAISGSEFSSSGITVGVDRRYDDQLALGMGLGYARDKTVIGSDGSVNRAKGYSLALYGSYAPTPDTYVDALLGVGSLDFDTRRFVAPMNDFALGKRNGTQWFGSLTGGYEFRNMNLLVSPYGRLDFSVDKLGTSTETGAGPYALTYFDQSNTSVQGALGVRGESIHATDFGYAVPRLRVEYRHEFKRAGQAFIGYADQIGGPRFALAPAGGPRDAIALGLGGDFIMRDGLTLSFEYQLSHSFSSASTHALRLRLSKDFDVKGLPRLLSEEPESAHNEPIDVQLEAGAVYDDNVTRAKAGWDKLSDSFYALNVSKTFVKPLTEQSRLLLTATAGGDKFRNYNGLTRLHASGEVQYQFRASSEFDAPTYGAFAKVTAEGFESNLRDGYRFATGVSFRQALTDRIGIFGALSHNRRNASSKVFSTIDNSVRGNIDYALSQNEILYLGAEYRRGDIVSTGRPSLENATVANVLTQDDAYPGGQFFSYRLRASTVLLTMGYNLGLGPQDSIDFSWRHIRSTPGLRPGFVTSPRSYLANQLSAVYLMRF